MTVAWLAFVTITLLVTVVVMTVSVRSILLFMAVGLAFVTGLLRSVRFALVVVFLVAVVGFVFFIVVIVIVVPVFVAMRFVFLLRSRVFGLVFRLVFGLVSVFLGFGMILILEVTSAQGDNGE